MSDIIYKASTTSKAFHKNDKFVRALIGPIGSGKSVACVVELLMKAYAQKPNSNNIRKSRWSIIRNTYRELSDTTMLTFFDWIPRSTGSFSVQNLKFTHIQKLPDGTTVHAEFLFRALDRPSDVKKLLSLELTGAWINEAREVPRQIFDMLQGRVGRYPSMRDGGASWFGIILDTNPPDTDHWWYKLFEEDIPHNHAIFHQPSGESAYAENIENLPLNYYSNMKAGKDNEWIKVYVHGQYGFISEGNPVYPEYKDNIHYSPENYVPNPKLPLFIGIDFGLTPAAVFGQLTASGRMVIFDELCTFDMGAVSFGRLLKQKINTTYKDFHNIEVYADPAGEHRSEVDETTPFMILAHLGIYANPTYTNDFTIRREAVADFMQRLDFAGDPAFCITPGAPMLRRSCGGGYKYKRMQVSGSEERFQDKPDKNKYSHVGDACQYLFLGSVGGDRIIGGTTGEINYSQTNLLIR